MNNKSSIVFFKEYDQDSKLELQICKKYFNTTNSRMIPKDQVVIGRYSVLPFYRELEEDLNYSNCRIINSYNEHLYIANMKNWAISYDNENLGLTSYTPKTWSSLQEVPDNIGPVILKGETNSRKEKWLTHCYANNKKEAIQVFMRLREDRFFDNQEIFIREFIQFQKYFDDPITKQPVIKEFRFFCYKDVILCGGFYWTNHLDDLIEMPKASDVPMEFLNKIMSIVKENTNFYVLDVAQTLNGEWMLIEINDGQCSGLSGCDPDKLYQNLNKEIKC